jgi:3',5'-cyclic AMP phosphodiesterase CpdA
MSARSQWRRRDVLIGASAAALPGTAAAGPRARGKPFRVAHLTDPHVMPERRAGEGFERCLVACQTHKPDLILLGGDLIMDAFAVDLSRVQAQWTVFKRVLAANVSKPVEACLGNHDVWGWGDVAKYEGEPGFGKQIALEALELQRSYRSFDRGGWHFIVLDSVHRLAGSGYTARLDDEQFAWLESDLRAVPSRVPVLILSHIPVLSACAYLDGDNEASGDWKVPGAWMHIDARRIKNLFHRHPNVKVCLSGHIHLVDRVDYLGVSYLCNGAVSGAWWKGPNQEFGNGYAIVDLFPDGAFTSTYHQFDWRAQPE